MTIIAPSILSADFTKLGQEIAEVERSGADWIHKIEEAQKILRDAGRSDCTIEVDGGINEKTAAVVSKAGATALVAGSAIFGAPNYRDAIDAIRRGARGLPSS